MIVHPVTTPASRTLAYLLAAVVALLAFTSCRRNAQIGVPSSAPLVSAEAFGIRADGRTDDTRALLGAIESLKTTGGVLLLPRGVIVVSGTIAIPRNTTLIGQYAGNPAAGHVDKTFGTVLKWAGPENQPVVAIVASQNVHMQSINIDGNGVNGVTGIKIDSNGVNIGPNGIILDRFSIWDCAIAIRCGTSGEKPAYQNDALTIRNFKIRDSVPGFGDVIVIDSNEALQGSVIEQGVIQAVRNGIQVKHAGGTFRIAEVLFGSLQGSDIIVDQAIDAFITTCHHEGGKTAIEVIGSDFLAGTITLMNNRWFNEPVVISRKANIVSIGNAGGPPAIIRVSGARVVSISDTFGKGHGWDAQIDGLVTISPTAVRTTSPIVTSGSPGFEVNLPPGQIKALSFSANGLRRWYTYCTEASEDGNNSGSDYAIACYDDHGRFLYTPFSIQRHDGAVSIRGSQSNDAAPRGMIGEFVESKRPFAEDLQLADRQTTELTSINLSPGDWDVDGQIIFLFKEAAPCIIEAATGRSRSELPDPLYVASDTISEKMASGQRSLAIPTQRVSIAYGTTESLLARASFAGGNLRCYGYIRARRAR